MTARRADNSVRFTIDGPGELVATDNGDPTSFEPFQSTERKAFNGYVVAILRSVAGRLGAITVRAGSPGLQGETVSCRIEEP